MKNLPSGLRRKAESLLPVYGGLEGFSKNPPWLIGYVLKTWFTEAERKLLIEFLYQGISKEARLPVLRELGAA